MKKTTEPTGPVWFKSSYSNSQSNCVEVAALESDRIGLRDTKHRALGPTMAFPAKQWEAFVGGAASGALDRS